MKGQDLLNNLFRVLLRFIENEFAIIADVTKMYNKILISEKDQLDQRCSWRDMEVDDEPDVYVKANLDVWRQTGFSYGIDSTSKNCQRSRKYHL